MVNEWYYQLDGEDIGPVPFEEIKQLAQSGTLTPESQIRDAVSGMLLPAKAIGGLFPDLPTPKRPQPVSKSGAGSSSGAPRKKKRPSSAGSSRQQQLIDEYDALEESRSTRTRPALEKTRTRTRQLQESPSAETREAASRISEYAQSVAQHSTATETEPKNSIILEVIKEHPLVTLLLFICLGVGIYLKWPLPDHSVKNLNELQLVYEQMKELKSSEETTEEDYQLFVDLTKTKFENIESKLFEKEELSEGEEMIQTIIRRELRPLLDPSASITEEQDAKIQRYMDEVLK